jgi:hypothetical protein
VPSTPTYGDDLPEEDDGSMMIGSLVRDMVRRA